MKKIWIFIIPLFMLGCVSNVYKSVVVENIATMENNLKVLKGKKISEEVREAYITQTEASIMASKQSLKNNKGVIDDITTDEIERQKDNMNLKDSTVRSIGVSSGIPSVANLKQIYIQLDYIVRIKKAEYAEFNEYLNKINNKSAEVYELINPHKKQYEIIDASDTNRIGE